MSKPKNYTGYLMGLHLARVKPSQLTSAAMNRASADPKKTARHMNSVFLYYYKTHKALQAARDAEKNSRGKKIARALIADLETTAKSGFYDLISVWQTLLKNGGKWPTPLIPTAAECMITGHLGAGGGGGYVIPQGIKSFEDAMQTRAQKVGSELRSIYGGKGVKQYAYNLKAYEDNKKWHDLAKHMENVNKVLDKYPQAWALMTCTASPMDTKYIDVAKRWIALGGYTHKFLTGYKQWERKGFRRNADEARNVAAVAAFLVDKAVPHFGSAYAEVIRGVPNAMKFMRKHRDRMNAAIALGGS